MVPTAAASATLQYTPHGTSTRATRKRTQSQLPDTTVRYSQQISATIPVPTVTATLPVNGIVTDVHMTEMVCIWKEKRVL